MFTTKLTEKIPHLGNAKEHCQSFTRKKNKISKTIKK